MSFKPHHVAFTIKDIEQSVDWYKSKLGFTLIHKYKNNGMEIALLQLDEVKVELFSFEENIQPLPNYRENLMDDLHVIGTKHLCIEVENLDEEVKELKSKGVEFVTEVDTAGFGGKYIFLKDCNNILIELYQA